MPYNGGGDEGVFFSSSGSCFKAHVSWRAIAGIRIVGRRALVDLNGGMWYVFCGKDKAFEIPLPLHLFV